MHINVGAVSVMMKVAHKFRFAMHLRCVSYSLLRYFVRFQEVRLRNSVITLHFRSVCEYCGEIKVTYDINRYVFQLGSKKKIGQAVPKCLKKKSYDQAKMNKACMKKTHILEEHINP